MKPTHSKQTAFTLVELLVVITIIAILAGFAISAMSSSSQKARTTKCAGFLRQIGTACLQYAGEHDGTLPVTSHQRRSGEQSWTLALQKYTSGTITFRCPVDEDKKRVYTYLLNDFLTPNPSGAADLDFSRLVRLEDPRATLMFGEASKDYTSSDHFHFSEHRGQKIPPSTLEGQIAVKRHLGSANYLFADAHVETLSWEKVQEHLREPGNRFIDPTAEPQR